MLHQVEQATGRGDGDIDAAIQGVHLVFLADAAEDHGLAKTKPLAVSAHLIGDLTGKLAGRREDESPRRAPIRGAGPVLCELVEDGQREGRGLTGAGLGNAQNVLAGKQFGNGPTLNRGGCNVVFCGKGLQDRLGKAEIRKTKIVHVNILIVQRQRRHRRGHALASSLIQARLERDEFR